MIRVILAIVGFFTLILIFAGMVAVILKVLPFVLVLAVITWIAVAFARNNPFQQGRESEPSRTGAGANSGTEQTASPGREKGQRHEAGRKRRQGQHRYKYSDPEQGRPVHGSHYEVLGVDPNATREEINKAWRRLDYGQPLPIETRRAYSKAHRILSDPEEQLKYDAELQRLRREKEQKQRQDREREEKRRQEQEQSRRRERKQENYRNAGKQETQPFSEAYYERLGVELTSTQQEIKRAWRTFAQQWHPDVCKRPKATMVFQAGSEAYSVLSDPEERRKYDAKLQRSRREQQGRQDENRHPKTWQGNEQGRNWHAPQNARRRQGSDAAKSAQQSRQRHSWRNSGRLFTGTWTRIQRGPLAGTWGVWIESLYVREGEKAIVRRRDGKVALVVVIQVLRRSLANRVTLCRVQNIAMP